MNLSLGPKVIAIIDSVQRSNALVVANINRLPPTSTGAQYKAAVEPYVITSTNGMGAAIAQLQAVRWGPYNTDAQAVIAALRHLSTVASGTPTMATINAADATYGQAETQLSNDVTGSG